MVKLVKKKKTLSTSKLVNQVLKIEADAQGLSLAEFKKKRDAIIKSQEEYKKTHWVSSLTDAQLYYIATQQDKEPYTYMGKPLSRSNLHVLNNYKQFNKNYGNYLNMVKQAQRLRDGIEKPLEPFKKLQQEYQDIGRRLRSTFAPEQEIAKKLSMGIGSLFNPFDIKDGFPKLRGNYLNHTGDRVRGGLLDIEPPVDKSHGLNTVMKKHKMKSALEIPAHFLKVQNDPKKLDYWVDTYGDADALAKACGVLPVKVFELICREVVKRKKHYKEQSMIAAGVACEELVNEFNDRKKKNETYPIKQFFRSKFRTDWSLRHDFDWSSYKRFQETFPKWIRIFNARAKKLYLVKTKNPQ